MSDEMMTEGERIASNFSMHLPTDTPLLPTGSDPKSLQVIAVLNQIAATHKASAEIVNASVDQLRENIRDAIDNANSSRET
ncbi:MULTISPECIES: hypothetical protein [unclassified Mycobacteroides]|uniref:hypothetical protein n=1 Tax=unclassified Mycobacteroides TaxID=2618759 RepID=UPI0007158DAD|nr:MULTISPECIES: hypothetical protein [unclassified Mycobacteroides]KRQ23335.1 hypothetical protein AOT91_23285 [Mycobacteroides sp. H092]KRQ23504.1 hypothetical protein AOT87_12545 [Mycobacteroides sp. H003]KRQ40313.1 hypothetical protein AOT92_15175 [Mycobacteroides sp. H101]KRQ47374.1 hypothetical protein AOT88_15745 [Mycobacteroides sp. H063]KRQ57761.1 hypothetical protein AOT90_25935 [Mycobacteroides sp. H079]